MLAGTGSTKEAMCHVLKARQLDLMVSAYSRKRSDMVMSISSSGE